MDIASGRCTCGWLVENKCETSSLQNAARCLDDPESIETSNCSHLLITDGCRSIFLTLDPSLLRPVSCS
jgi:hypothetical protein